MPLYSCEACNFSTKIKTQYKQHLQTKKHSKNTKEITPNNEIPKIENPEGSTKEHKYRKLGAQRSTKEHATQNPIFSCEHCNKGFSSFKILTRHQKLYCSEISQKSIYKKTEVEELKNIIKEEREEHKREKEKLYQYIDKLIEKAGYTINNTQNITLNNFGNEDLSHITDKVKTDLIKLPFGMIPKMIEYVHFNNEKPENKNNAITNKKEKLIKVFKENKWCYQTKHELLDDLIQTNYNRLDEFYENNGISCLNDQQNVRYKKFQELFDGEDSEVVEQIKKKSELILLNDSLKDKTDL